MKDKLLKLIREEIKSRDEIPYSKYFIDLFCSQWLEFKFEDGEPTIRVYINKFISSCSIISIVCGCEYYLTKEETGGLKEFVGEQERLKIEAKIDKRLEKYGSN